MPTRGLKESITTSETIDVLSAEAEVLFYRLLVVADDYGLFDGRKSIIRGRCYPLKDPKDVSDRSLTEWLRQLEQAPLIRFYEVDGKPFLSILKWENFQRIRNVKPKYPLPTSDNSRTIDSNLLAVASNPPPMAARASVSVSEPESEPKADVRKSPNGRFVLPDWIPSAAWDGYVEMRVKIKAPMTEHAKALSVGKLDALRAKGFDPAAVLNEATEKSWRGIYEPKGGPPSTPAKGGVMPGMEGVL
jgi:hypothetical protein